MGDRTVTDGKFEVSTLLDFDRRLLYNRRVKLICN